MTLEPGGLLGDLGPAATIHIEEACGAPQTISEAIAAAARDGSGEITEVQTGFVIGEPPYREALRNGDLRCVTWMPGNGLRATPVDVVRLSYPETAQAYRAGALVADAVAVSVTDAGSLGIQSGYTPAVIESVRKRGGGIVVERNSRLADVRGAPEIDLAGARIVESNRPPPESPVRAPSQTQRAAAANAASLVPAGACVEIGLGSLCDAVLARLAAERRRRLSFHSGMLSDAVLGVAEAGLDVAATPVGGAPFTCGLLVGTRRLWSWAARDDRVRLAPLELTHGPNTLSAIEKFCAINSVLQVDLAGNANAESIAGKQISGPGGQPAFAWGATHAPDGRSIVVLTSTTPAGDSSIVVDLDGPTTTPSANVDFVVTEHGIADIRGASVEERARSLAAIAAVEHRRALLAGRD